MKIVLIGPQGSGKSTQAEKLSLNLNVPHLSTGDLFRRLQAENSPLSEKLKSFLQTGRLVPDEIVFEVLKNELGQIKYQNGFVLDGFPRTVNQAEGFNQPIDAVIYLDLSDRETIKRLSLRARSDDTPALIARRLKDYHRQTEPLLEFYRNKNILIEIDGGQSIEEIQKEILEKIKKTR